MGISQAREKEKKLRIVGRIVAYDSFASLMNISAAPSQDVFVFEVIKPLKIRDQSKYVKLIYDSFGSSNVERLFLSEPTKHMKLDLRRRHDCDSSILDMETKKVKGVDGSSTRLNSLTYFVDIPDVLKKDIVPCYVIRKIVKSW